MSERDSGVPEGRCGFEVRPEDVGSESDLADFHKEIEAVSCWRKTWRSGRCLWHTDTDEKPVDELVAEAQHEPDRRLDGAIFRDVELNQRISFADFTLTGARFENVDLKGANFSDAYLRWADFSDAFLEKAEFSDADLSEAEFPRADLWQAQFPNAHLSEAEFPDAHLREAQFPNALLIEAQFPDAHLREAQFPNALLVEAQFPNAHLSEAEFPDADLPDAEFPNANLEGARFPDAYLLGAEFPNADLRGARFPDAYLLEAKFPDADLSLAGFLDADLPDAEFPDAVLEKAEFPDADLEGAEFPDADLSGAEFPNTDLSGATLTNATLESATLTNANLADSDLTGARLDDARLRDVSINDGTEFGDWCAYEQDADPIGPPPETDADGQRLFPFIRTRIARRWHSVKTGLLRMRAYWSPDDREDTVEQLDTAVSVYRTRQRLYRENSLPGKVSEPYVREKHCRQKRAFLRGRAGRYLSWPKWVLKRWVMLYGESPWRIVYTSVASIVVFAVLYQLIGGVLIGGGDGLRAAQGFVEHLYFSAVTFSTLGYANIAPDTTAAQLLAGVQSLLGGALIALLVVVLGRHIMR